MPVRMTSCTMPGRSPKNGTPLILPSSGHERRDAGLHADRQRHLHRYRHCHRRGRRCCHHRGQHIYCGQRRPDRDAHRSDDGPQRRQRVELQRHARRRRHRRHIHVRMVRHEGRPAVQREWPDDQRHIRLHAQQRRQLRCQRRRGPTTTAAASPRPARRSSSPTSLRSRRSARLRLAWLKATSSASPARSSIRARPTRCRTSGPSKKTASRTRCRRARSIRYRTSTSSPTTMATMSSTLKITDDAGAHTSSSTTFSVINSAPIGTISGEPNGSINEGDTISLAVSVADAGTQDTFDYVWSITKDNVAVTLDPTLDVNSDTFNYVTTDNGSYVVSCKVTDNDGDSHIADSLPIVRRQYRPDRHDQRHAADVGQRRHVAELRRPPGRRRHRRHVLLQLERHQGRQHLQHRFGRHETRPTSTSLRTTTAITSSASSSAMTTPAASRSTAAPSPSPTSRRPPPRAARPPAAKVRNSPTPAPRTMPAPPTRTLTHGPSRKTASRTRWQAMSSRFNPSLVFTPDEQRHVRRQCRRHRR